ncbi:AsnC family transcriptional regulator [Halorubrum sp. Ib24]|uniref:TrkA C-terminal domain-containing protein n=1 Tax=unclassified Halorubrum TaxID=2642239 RepID=UPI000B99D258|nr:MULTISPECIES: Lrp/AsnC family transcriptional regulator [unclassified Halorubrum]OYR40625.1 AsnC family transcriptional regulator [Halorubrum sp. Eb13]OYR43016.1 AsnC family transcriptional regulator [Halorubrum sp. Ib24]OYR43083.1 AsnC family transcriptional regulator [Halorubrum sp. Hd13]OYR47135.1 AsnC family transcriptional regulator [Halorubrum sp. Ea8]OYR54364.1 AsnC family transcriptional regulator [Halorubrum sp. Ea1]
MGHRLDEIDKRVLYYFAVNARNTATSDIAEEMGVTPATIRNRIDQLEDRGILRSYLADIDYKSIDGYITYLFRCTAPIPDRTQVAQSALDVSGVVTVQELMSGSGNLLVTVVGADTDDINHVAGELSDLGLRIEDESVMQGEYHRPYDPFGPETVSKGPSLTDFMSLAGDAEVAEFSVSEDAEIAGKTIEQAVDEGHLSPDTHVVGIEREGDMLTPKGQTTFRAGDIVSLLSKAPFEQGSLGAFGTPRK